MSTRFRATVFALSMSSLLAAGSCGGDSPPGTGRDTGGSGPGGAGSTGGGDHGGNGQGGSGGSSQGGNQGTGGSGNATGGAAGDGSGGNGGAGTGGGGPGGSSGAGGMEIMCPAGQSRCECHTARGDGINVVIDDFEDSDLKIAEIDDRRGEWFGIGLGSGTASFKVETTSLSAPESTKAMHMAGGAAAPQWPTFGVPLGICYDASQFSGISFWLKGNAGAGNKSVKFAIGTPPTTEKSAGGTCPDGDLGCYNNFADQDFITVTPTWTKYSFAWSQLKQGAWGPGTENGLAPAGYQPQKQILNITFAPIDNKAGYDFWVDDVRLDASAPGSCADLINQQTFEGFFPNRNGFYTYAGFAAAAKQWPKFCGEGSVEVKKREAAAFFAHMVQETAGLKYKEEIGCEAGQCVGTYCDNGRADFPCAPGKSYHGRGPLQLTWNNNYGAAGSALGLSLLSEPETVLKSPTNAFNAALWFWMTRQPIDSAHNMIVTDKGFGATIQIVNGPLECGGKNPNAVNTRVNAFTDFCGRLGVPPGGNQGC